MTDTMPAAWSTRRGATCPAKARVAVRRRTTRERSSLLRSRLDRHRLRDKRRAKRVSCGAGADARSAPSRHRRMDCFGHCPGALAKVPCMSGGVRRDRNRSRAFGSTAAYLRTLLVILSAASLSYLAARRILARHREAPSLLRERRAIFEQLS